MSDEKVEITPGTGTGEGAGQPNAQPENQEKGNQDGNTQPPAAPAGGSNADQAFWDQKRKDEYHYMKRHLDKSRKEKMDKVEQELAEEEKLLDQQIRNGEVKDPNILQEMLREKEEKIRAHELEKLVAQQPELAQHKEKIESALKDPRYANLSLDEVARLAAGVAVEQMREKEEQIKQSATPAAASARGLRTFNGPHDYSNASAAEIQELERQAKTGRKI